MELREWKYIIKPTGSTTNNSSSAGYKKRFERLIKYHLDHASSELESVTRKDISDWHFRLGEHYNIGSQEFDRDIIVVFDKATSTFSLAVFVDDKQVAKMQCEEYEVLVELLDGDYMYLARKGTKDFDTLISESLNEWQLMNPPQATTSKNSNTENHAFRYDKLLDQIIADGIATYKLNKLTKDTLDITVDTKRVKDLNIKIIYNQADDDYELITNNKTSLSGCDYEKDILFLLQAGGVINNTNLCESEYALADDFQLYDFLWENI